MSPITFTQQGIITQCELAKILIITSDGLLEVALPLTDDDRRDMEIHMWGKFARNIVLLGPQRQVDQSSKFLVPSATVGARVLDIFGNEQVRQDTSPLPPGLAELDGLVLVGQRP